MTAEPPKVQIYVRLLDEDTDVWRPLAATQAGDAYLLEGPATEGELLEFPVGTLVRCEPRKFQDAQQAQLVAVSAALQWGDSVIVKPGARPAWRPGVRAEVCGVRQVETPDVAATFGAAVGTQLLLIEFSDGSSVEVPEAVIERDELRLAGDDKIRARSSKVSRLLRGVVEGEERPVFVSDQASLLDLSSQDEATLMGRIRETYGVTVTSAELALPLWQLVDRLQPDGPVSPSRTPAFIDELQGAVPEILPLLREHLSDYEEVLPHVLMGDVTRLAISAATAQRNDELLARLLGFLELKLGSTDEVAENIVLVSFIENLAGEAAALEVMKPMMGPLLRAATGRWAEKPTK